MNLVIGFCFGVLVTAVVCVILLVLFGKRIQTRYDAVAELEQQISKLNSQVKELNNEKNRLRGSIETSKQHLEDVKLSAK